jgi:CheY-like chemotaxis protein
MKKFLFIDDDAALLNSLKRHFKFFEVKSNIIFAECHSVQEALRVIAEHQPNVIFLDHSLTKNGDEGLEIARAIKDKGIKIFSTSALYGGELAEKYEKYGIGNVDKFKTNEIRSLIERLDK